ncbi:conserved exported protein of unknown function [Sterolibacterium denitrificans]|uniref:C-type lysozyme inhibitor domain-containing protein n=1 Tax=Sterolibacterium denitrificans TaxID=157592 RepID=A0A7Z7HPK6_9PROT|nr:MliC family protein [Sterolibacterium denitrificans]SMB22200.1 conserved exported protein of unknown function [Sterolibacterium denitrificans]
MKFLLPYRRVLPIAALVLAVACTSPEQAAPVVGSGVFVADSVTGTDEMVHAEYRADDTVVLKFADGRRKQLPRAISASGARYAANGEEWWEHQGEARYSVNDATVFVGRLQPQPQSRRQP